MKKITLIISFIIAVICVKSQVLNKQIDISDISGTDTSYYFNKYTDLKYSYDRFITVIFSDVTGTGGEIYETQCSVDSLVVVDPSTRRVINSDTTFIFTGGKLSAGYNGFYYNKGSTTAGKFTWIIDRKTNK